MSERRRLMLSLSSDEYRRLQVVAGASGVPAPQMAALLVRRALPGPVEAATPTSQLDAETQLCGWVCARARSVGTSASWDENVTLRIFQEIESDHAELYEVAASGGQRSRINKLIGSLVRRELGAVPRMVNGRPMIGHPKRGECGLIGSYTRLYPPPAVD